MDELSEEEVRVEIRAIRAIPVASRSEAKDVRLNTLEAEIQRRQGQG